MYRLRIGLFTTIALAALSVGCAKKTASDDALANDIKGKLYSDQVTKPANIDVAVKNGVVTLSGDVPSSDVELEAVKLANGASGRYQRQRSTEGERGCRGESAKPKPAEPVQFSFGSSDKPCTGGGSI